MILSVPPVDRMADSGSWRNRRTIDIGQMAARRVVLDPGILVSCHWQRMIVMCRRLVDGEERKAKVRELRMRVRCTPNS